MAGQAWVLKGLAFDAEYNDTASWATPGAQFNTLTNRAFAYARLTDGALVERIIKFDGSYDDLFDCNYIIWENDGGRVYYAFITSVRQLGSNTVGFAFEVDVVQTYYFDLSFGTCGIERGHVMDDRVGVNTVPEGLEHGPYKFTQSFDPAWRVYADDSYIGGNVWDRGYYVMVASTYDYLAKENVYVSQQNNICSGLVYFYYDWPVDRFVLRDTLATIVGDNKGDAIKGLFMIPKAYVSTADEQYRKGETSTNRLAVKCAMPAYIDNYIPRNQKLYCEPYNYLYMSNRQGQYATLAWEKFDNIKQNPAVIDALGILSESSKAMAVPRNYNGVAYNYDEGISMPSWLQCSWSSDMFTTWLAQNGASWAIGGLIQIGTTVASAATGNVAGLVTGVSSVIGSLVQFNQHYNAPPSLQGNSGAVSTLAGKGENWFSVWHQCIRREFAEKLDDFFHMYGYKRNAFEVPNRRARSRWNFIQLNMFNASGAIPGQYMSRLRDIHLKGIRYWNNVDDIGNFGLNNYEGVARD